MNSSKGIRIIGLTGGIGTGKSTAAEYLAAKGLDHIDADAISRSLTQKGSPALDKIAAEFSEENASAEGPLFTPDGALDRKAMAALVFSDPQKKARLEKILFAEIGRIFRERIEKAERDVLLDVPLLFETGTDSLCDVTIVLTADPATRIRRVMERDGCSEEEVLARIRNQMPEEEKCALADYVVDNSGSLAQLQEKLDDVIRKISSNPVDKSGI